MKTPPSWLLYLWLGTAFVGLLLCLGGLTAHLRLGNTAHSGMLLVPQLPASLYIVMAVVVVLGIGLTLLVSITQRRRKAERQLQKHQETARTPWQAALSMLATLAVFAFLLWWVVRYGAHLQALFARLRVDVESMQGFFEEARSMVRQVHSPTAGYAVFTAVMVVYGGMAVLAGWVLLESFAFWRLRSQTPSEEPQRRQVRRAVQAGLRALHDHSEPRAAIIACYARLEHLLEDYGVPVAQHLTPQEYLKSVLQELELPLDILTALVELFELARYSLHPLEDADRLRAIGYLENLQHHLQGAPLYGYQS